MASLAHQNRPALSPGSPDSPKQAMCTSLLQDHTMPKLSESRRQAEGGSVGLQRQHKPLPICHKL